MIIRNGFVRDVNDGWVNLSFVKRFEVKAIALGDGNETFFIDAILDTNIVTVGEGYDTYQKAQEALDKAFSSYFSEAEYEEGEEESDL